MTCIGQVRKQIKWQILQCRSRCTSWICNNWTTGLTAKLPTPFLHASIRQTEGGGLCAGSYFHVSVLISILSLAVRWIKQEKYDKVIIDMTQVTSVLTIAGDKYNYLK